MGRSAHVDHSEFDSWFRLDAAFQLVLSRPYSRHVDKVFCAWWRAEQAPRSQLATRPFCDIPVLF